MSEDTSWTAITCPLCGEDDFDAPGFVDHIERRCEPAEQARVDIRDILLSSPSGQPGTYGFLYDGPQTICPGCHKSNWIVGRKSAECGWCGTALPFAPERK